MVRSEKLLVRAVKLPPGEEDQVCKGVGVVVLVAYPSAGRCPGSPTASVSSSNGPTAR